MEEVRFSEITSCGAGETVQRTRGACPPPPEANTEHVWKGEQEVHWTYRLLRRIAFTSLAIVFWTWVIMLALSGRF